MQDRAKKQHWENIYHTKDTTSDVSWYQDNPHTSIDLILSTRVSKDGRIIDVGSGDSRLVDNLLKQNYKNLFVLDISGRALEKARTRLGNKANSITWIESDILKFETDKQFDIWHDRATFHFLTSKVDITRYVAISCKLIKPDGFLILSTFSTNGPDQCSGLNISQYSKETIKKTFERHFSHIKSFRQTHTTPFRTKQNFIWSVFRRSTKD